MIIKFLKTVEFENKGYVLDIEATVIKDGIGPYEFQGSPGFDKGSPICEGWIICGINSEDPEEILSEELINDITSYFYEYSLFEDIISAEAVERYEE